MDALIRHAAIRAALVTGLFAISHSILASLPVKRRVHSLAGERRARGLYRFGYCGVSVLSFAAVLRSIWKLPDRTLYRVQGLPKSFMVLGQILAAAALIETNRQNRFGRVSGITQARGYISDRPISPPVVAQHPLPDGDCLEGWTGPFRLSSHPNNYGVLLLYWLSPAMTVKWAAVGAVTAAYMVLGSMHEDQRLRHAYGSRYACYRERVPHLFVFPIDVWRRRRRV